MIIFGVTVGIEGKNGDAIAGRCPQLAQAVGQFCHALAMFVPVALACAHNRGTGIWARIRCCVHELREICHLAPLFFRELDIKLAM